jgi:hypothetical protein
MELEATAAPSRMNFMLLPAAPYEHLGEGVEMRQHPKN